MKYLLVIPSIDIKDGKTVRVVQGIPELDCKEYGSNPIEMARIWRAENAKIIHVVDFDAAHDHSHKNLGVIEEICNSVIIPVQFAGGIRNIEDGNLMFDVGVLRLVITTMAIDNRQEFIKLFEKYGPAKIIVALDIFDGQIIIRGRQTKTGIFYKDFAREMAEIGIERFVVTDVRKNGVLGGPNLELAEEIAEFTGGKITLSGGIRNKDELLDVQKLMPLGVDSVIVGRALYENKFPCQKLWRVAESGIFE
ncbi:MAG: 1-(5-phosphoribosyl)-5-[(5-phosphoribosylamino)methylideneamino] imidazole-4-carboxamide isomerase [Ignavibacteriaceae bacterium]